MKTTGSTGLLVGIDLGSMVTFSGLYINPVNPNPEKIKIEDIAHALSQLCRFGGHTNQFYSVAQHCCHVHDFMRDHFDCSENQKLAGLLHDAAEAYLVDLPRPVKGQIPQYKEIEYNLMQVIFRKFGVTESEDTHVLVKQADDAVLRSEAESFMPNGGKEWDWEGIDNRGFVIPSAWTPATAKHTFLRKFNALYPV